MWLCDIAYIAYIAYIYIYSITLDTHQDGGECPIER